MSAQHTQGRLHVDQNYTELVNIKCGDDWVAEATSHSTIQLNEANARRLVACWNACEGISTENLENNVPVKELAKRYNAVIRQRDRLPTALQAAGERVSWLRDQLASRGFGIEATVNNCGSPLPPGIAQWLDNDEARFMNECAEKGIEVIATDYEITFKKGGAA
jgi:hypothetical protein